MLREYFMQTQIKMPKSYLERLVELAYLEKLGNRSFLRRGKENVPGGPRKSCF